MKTLSNALHGWFGAIILVALFSFAADQGDAQQPFGTSNGQKRTAAVERGELDLSVRATGTLEPEMVIDVSPEVSGMVKKFGADAATPNHEIYWGSKVDVGTVLAYLDDSQYRDAFEAAQIKLRKSQAIARGAKAESEKATADLDRLEKLAATQAAVGAWRLGSARTALDVAKANADAADAQVDLDRLAIKRARIDLDRTIIRSPVKGVVIDRRLNVGQIVHAGDVQTSPTLFLIASDLAKIQIWISISESDIHQIHVGQKVQFTVDAMPGKEFEARVDQIRLNAAMNNNLVTYTVTAAVDNSKGLLLPYETATVNIVVAKHANSLMVPAAALAYAARYGGIGENARAAEKHQKLVIVDDGKSQHSVAVALGESEGNMVKIKSGNLKEGMQLVVGQ